MKQKILLLTISLLLSVTAFSQAVKEVRHYYGKTAKLAEVYTVKVGTGIKHGKYKKYSFDGNLILDCNYKNNYLDGEYKEYYDVAPKQLKEKSFYTEGELDETKPSEFWDYDRFGDGGFFLAEKILFDKLGTKIIVTEKDSTIVYKDGKRKKYKDGKLVFDIVTIYEFDGHTFNHPDGYKIHLNEKGDTTQISGEDFFWDYDNKRKFVKYNVNDTTFEIKNGFLDYVYTKDGGYKVEYYEGSNVASRIYDENNDEDHIVDTYYNQQGKVVYGVFTNKKDNLKQAIFIAEFVTWDEFKGSHYKTKILRDSQSRVVGQGWVDDEGKENLMKQEFTATGDTLKEWTVNNNTHFYTNSEKIKKSYNHEDKFTVEYFENGKIKIANWDNGNVKEFYENGNVKLLKELWNKGTVIKLKTYNEQGQLLLSSDIDNTKNTRCEEIYENGLLIEKREYNSSGTSYMLSKYNKKGEITNKKEIKL
jgi:antitoxin component YwqK of YwqJK toxin-antitoxin module